MSRYQFIIALFLLFAPIASPTFAMDLLGVAYEGLDEEGQSAAGEDDADIWHVKSPRNKYAAISFAEKMKRIKELAYQLHVNAEEESEILELIGSMDKEEAKPFINELQADGAKLLKELECSIDGERYQKLYELLISITFATMPPEELLNKLETAKIFHWSDPGLFNIQVLKLRFYFEDVELQDDGQLYVKYWKISPLMWNSTEHTLHPFEIVGVNALIDERTFDMKKGQTIFGPAFILRAFERKQKMQEWRLTLDIVGVMAGGAGLVTATTRTARAAAAIQAAISAGDLVVNETRQSLMETQEGREFLKYWDITRTLVAIYDITKLLSGPAGIIFKKLSDRYPAVRNKLAQDLSPEEFGDLEKSMKDLTKNYEDASPTLNTRISTGQRLFGAKLKAYARAEKALLDAMDMVSKSQRGKRGMSVVVAVTHPKVDDVVIALNGAAPTGKVAKQLQERARALGGIGTTRRCNIYNSDFTIGRCAEFRAANALLLKHPNLKLADIVFSRARNPRKLDVKPYCQNCREIFGL